jgi:GNAT superfamily N-acetyltransferase
VRAIRVESNADRERFGGMPGVPAPAAAADVEAERPDEQWMVVDADGAALARASLWWSEAPPYEGHRPGVVGHYAARSDDAASALLEVACARLRESGCTLAVGPMDGNTWRRYRFVVERGSEPAFFLDIDQPDAWPAQFIRAGFRVMARYCSTLNADVGRRHQREAEWEQRVHAQHIRLRAIDVAEFEVELKRIFDLSCAAFARNFLYTPIDEAGFLRQYLPLKRHIRPELVLLAERGVDMVGFVFCIPDFLQERRGVRIDTVVLKTFAVHPGASGLGLGSHLAASAQRVAFESGYKRLIYAFMHEDNPSLRISAHFAHSIRDYALYCKELPA